MMGQNETLTWTGRRRLAWSDFAAEHNPASYADSCSVIRYGFTWTVDSEDAGGEIVFLIKNIAVSTDFCPLLSSVRTFEKSDRLLRYEQGRFDLAELVRRENIPALQGMFANRTFPTRGKNEEQRRQFAKEDSGRMVAQEVEKLQKILDGRLQEYDRATDYGNDSEKICECELDLKPLTSADS